VITIEKSKLAKKRAWFSLFPFGVCAILFGAQLRFILKYAVDIPYWDEWETLLPNALEPMPSGTWFFELHNEHRIVFTKILTWLLYLINGWDLRTNIILNWFIFGGLVYFLYALCKNTIKAESSYLRWSFILLFSTLPIENFIWGFQSQFHFFILFFLFAVFFLFRPQLTYKDVLLGALSCVCATFSFSSGLICTLVVLIAFNIWQLGPSHYKKRPWKTLLILNTIVIIGIALWAQSYIRPAGHPSLTLPITASFYNYFFNLISLGFGRTHILWIIGFFCTLWVLFPLVKLFLDPKTRWNSQTWTLITSVGGILATLGVIAMGRAGFGVSQSKSSRYAEIGVILIPLSLASWELLFAKQRLPYRKPILSLFLFILILSFSTKWRPSGYRDAHLPRMAGIECIREYYKTGKEAMCPTLYPAPINSRLDRAKELGISFYKKLNL
jgi:hypothetical protein